MTQHASSLPPSEAPEPTYAERARTLLELENLGMLSTNSARHPGWPFGSVMPYALTSEGAPFFLISSMAIHTQNVVADSRASLLVMQRSTDADPLGLARATLLGHVVPVEPVSESLRARYLEQHPNARHWIAYSDFRFFRLEVAQIYFVGGFGAMGWVPAEEYAAAQPDPLAHAAPGIIEHMNRDHAEALRDITRHFGHLPADEAVMLSCDRLGFVVRARTSVGMKGLRLAFSEEVRSSDDARRVLVAMVRQARAGR